jgi:hypothetical protein
MEYAATNEPGYTKWKLGVSREGAVGGPRASQAGQGERGRRSVSVQCRNSVSTV